MSVTSLAKGDVVNSGIVGLPLGYAAGQLLYMAIGDDALFNVAFDSTAARAMQNASVVLVGAWNAALSATGVLVPASGGRAARVLCVSADGRTVTPIPGHDSVIRAGDARLSPDGSQLAFTRDDGNRNASIAKYTFANATTSRLATIGMRPEWMPDGARVFYQIRNGPLGTPARWRGGARAVP